MVSNFILILSLSSESEHLKLIIFYMVSGVWCRNFVSKYKCCLFITRGCDKSRNLIFFIIESFFYPGFHSSLTSTIMNLNILIVITSSQQFIDFHSIIWNQCLAIVMTSCFCILYWMSVDVLLFRSLLKKLSLNKATVIMNFKVNMYCLEPVIATLMMEKRKAF